MSFFHISCLLFMCFLTSLIEEGSTSNLKNLKDTENITLSFKIYKDSSDTANDDVVEEIKELQSNTIYYIRIVSIPEGVQFIILQTHVYLHNVTLGYNIEQVKNQYVTGQNIGLVQNITKTRSAQFFLENDNNFNVTALLAIVAYNKSAPEPGGCNMEFEVETAPWLHVNVTGSMVVVTSQPAKPPLSWGVGGTCSLLSLQYHAYHIFLPEKNFLMDTYFDYIRKMITVKRIIQNGRKVADYMGNELRHVYSAYHGTGSVYTIVVTGRASQFAAYVPALTYTCNPAQYTDSCQVLTSTFSRSLCALVLFIGLFICLFGHSFFQTELFLMSTLMGSIVTYVLIFPYGFTDSASVMIATLGGVTTGNFWLLVWWLCGSPMLSILMASLTLGFLLTSLLFYTAIGDLLYMDSDVNYWLAFLCCMLAIGLLFAPQTNRVNILSCSVVGSYAAIVPIDHYVGANLKYIFINTIRRATVPGFNEAIIDPPFQTKDIILSCIWIMLAVVGFVLQSQRFGDRPPFPRSSRPWNSPSAVSTTPLLPEQRPLLYGQPVTLTNAQGVDGVAT